MVNDDWKASPLRGEHNLKEDSEDSNSESDKIEISRRKFLKWSSYIPPAITGLIISSNAAHAATCNPDLCGPDKCGPDDSCGPDSCPPNF